MRRLILLCIFFAGEEDEEELLGIHSRCFPAHE